MISTRTIFLLIRGEYMAGLAVQRARKDILKLKDAEYQLAKQTQQMAYGMIFAGGAFVAFGGMIVSSMMRIMEKYAEGHIVVTKFHKEWDRAMTKLAVNIAQNLGPTLIALAKILNVIASNPIAVQLMFWGAVILILAGAFQFLWGTILMLISTLGLLFKSQTLCAISAKLAGLGAQEAGQRLMTAYFPATMMAKTGTDALTTSTLSLAGAVGLVMTGFTVAIIIVETIGRLFGRLPAIITGVTIAVLGLAVAIVALRASAGDITGLVTFAASLAAGGALMAGYAATLAEYQLGTSFVRKGGMAILHGGEEIKSARETTAISKIEKQRRGVGASSYTRSIWHLPITIENLYTKSDRDNIARELRRGLKDILDKKV